MEEDKLPKEILKEERIHQRRGAGFWTLAEHISHLSQVQPMLLKRLGRFMNEDHPDAYLTKLE